MGLDERDSRGFPKRWTGLAATGTNQAAAFVLLDGGYHEFTTVVSGTGASLPVVFPWSREITISNNGANALLIYPPSGGTIDTSSSSVSLAAGSSATYWATSPTNWQDRVTGGSGGGGGGSSTITEVSQTSSFAAAAGSFYAVSGSSAVTATLPTAAGIAGQTIRVRCANSYTGLCTITGTGGQTIGGQASRIIFAGESPLLQSDGANWVRTGGIVIQSYCVMNNSAFQSPVYNTPTTVNFDTIVKDNTGIMANITNHTIAAIRPGRYRFWSIVSFGITGGPTLAFSLYIAAVKNSTNEFFDDNTYYMNNLFSSMTVSEKCGGIISLAAADTMKVQWNETNSGGSTPFATVNGLGSTGGAPFTQVELEEILDW